MQDPDYPNIANVELIESLYEGYRKDPNSVDASWRYFFQGMEFSSEAVSGADIRSYLMIDTFRRHGHKFAKVNPLTHDNGEVFKVEDFGFKEVDLDILVDTFGVMESVKAPLKDLYQKLVDVYSSRAGIEFMHTASEVRDWLLEQLEGKKGIELSKDERIKLMQELNRSELFETFLHTKFVGQKRFSVEGNETLIPVLYSLIECGAEHGVEEVVLGMAHRGRLNVLANIMHKSYAMIFHEFDEKYQPKEYEGLGDAKYHKGFSRDYTTPTGKNVHLHLAANPSHLEAINSVVLGQTRAKQDLNKTKKVESILIHGDAALAGQGIVYETMQFLKLDGYKTNGTVHVVVNNQIGFTTLPEDSRSTEYCTDIAKPFGSVVFHVNAEDPEMCLYASKLACQIRFKFSCDVFIDLIGYRKYGHNEADEPFFTQPLLYKTIKEKKTIRELYQDYLIANNLVEKELLEKLEQEFRDELQKNLEASENLLDTPPEPEEMMGGFWKNFVQPSSNTIYDVVPTRVSKEDLIEIRNKIATIPEGFSLHPKLAKIQEARLQIPFEKGEKVIDWGFAELMAFASIVKENIPVRLAGQDSRRGTFNHRHAMWIDQTSGQTYFPVNQVNPSTSFDVYNSPLSEFASLGFEYGYSLSNPHSLVLWEAQFGDFCNGAQIIIDQYISTSEEKWSRYTSVTMLLPHGYEGQGPEHSSGRMERFLELCGDKNMIVTCPSTPAQYFHLLRRQAKRTLKKPLIVFTPKSLLRNPECRSAIEEFTENDFQEVLLDPITIKKPRKILLCTGKIYYDLDAYRKEKKIEDVAIIRIEQLFPLHKEKLIQALSLYPDTLELTWVQEEPENMGVYTSIFTQLKKLIPEKSQLKYIGRRASGSPATGSLYVHKKQQSEIITKAFE